MSFRNMLPLFFSRADDSSGFVGYLEGGVRCYYGELDLFIYSVGGEGAGCCEERSKKRSSVFE